jgi:hypothetical protein
VAGYTYRGLGLWIAIDGSPKGRIPPQWSLSHLGSGHNLCYIKGDVATAFPIATEIAEAGDWGFLSLDGWRDRFPDAPKRLDEIIARYPKLCSRGARRGADREVAAQIAANQP